MKNPNNTVKLSGKLYNFRSLSSLDLLNFIPFKSNVIFYQKFDRLHDKISNQNITYNNVVVKNGFYFDSSKKSYVYFKNPKIQHPYSIVVTFKAISGAKQFISQNSNPPNNSPSSYVPIIYFNQNGSITFEIYEISRSIYNNINVFDDNTHNIVLQVGSNYYKYTVDKDTKNSVIVNGNINLSWATYYVLGAGYGRDHGNSWNYFNGYIYKFAIYNKTFNQIQLDKVLDWL